MRAAHSRVSSWSPLAMAMDRLVASTATDRFRGMLWNTWPGGSQGGNLQSEMSSEKNGKPL